MNIDLILPVNNPYILSQQAIDDLNLPNDIKCRIQLPDNNLLEITNAKDEAEAIPSIVKTIIASSKDNIDAAIVYCFGEPGVEQARSKVSFPVFGIASPAMHIAAQLGKHFSVVASVEAHCPLIKLLADRFGLSNQMCPPLAVNISPDKLINNNEALLSILLPLVKHSIEHDKIDTLVLGCGSLQPYTNNIRQLIKSELGYDIIVIDPLAASIYFVAAIINMKLKNG